MRAKRVDANQRQIMQQCRQIPGVMVRSTHELGNGIGDVILGYRKANYLFEIKDEAKVKSAKKLTPAEQKFHNNWTGQICVIENIEDILKIINKNN